MASVEHYAVLELPRGAGADDIKAAYRRLAKIRHPDKNPNDPQATANFQKLQNAYSTLCDPIKRSIFDAQYRPATGPNKTQHGAQGSPEEKRTNPSQNPETDEIRKCRQQSEELESRLQTLAGQKTRAEADLASAQSILTARKETFARLQAEVAKDEGDDAARRGWFGFLWRLTPEQQEEFDRQLTSRRTGLLVIEKLISQITSEVKTKKEVLARVDSYTRELRWKKDGADYEYLRATCAEQKRRQQEQQEAFQQARREWQQREQTAHEAAFRRRKEEAEARQKRDEDEARQRREEAAQARKAHQEELRKSEEARRKSEESKARSREAKKAAQARKQRRTKDSGGQPRPCQHRAWWNEVPGPSSCERCKRRTPRFVFQCPGCEMRACASCRVALKRGA